MLVLSRHRDEITDLTVRCKCGCETPITIIVIEVRGDKTRLGFRAGNTVEINRREVTEAIEREKRNQS